jgi:hypothetical protein
LNSDVLAPKCTIANPEDTNIDSDDVPKVLERGDFEGGSEDVMSLEREGAEDAEDAHINDMPSALESGGFEGRSEDCEVVMSVGREEAEDAYVTNFEDFRVESVQPSINDGVSAVINLLNNLLT